MLVVLTPAADYNLLTAAELRTAVGLTAADTTADSILTPLGLRVSNAIAAECGVAADGVSTPTLRSEVLRETFRAASCAYGLRLSRRPIVSVQSVVEAGTTLDSSDYEIAEGGLTRLSDDEEIAWAAGKTVVSYTAGWATVPDDLKMAATALTRAWYFQNGRDPLLKSRDVPDVYREAYALPGDPAALSGSVPADVGAMLARFRVHWFV